MGGQGEGMRGRTGKGSKGGDGGVRVVKSSQVKWRFETTLGSNIQLSLAEEDKEKLQK